MRFRLRLTLIVIGVLTGVMAAGPAWAHTATSFYVPKWSAADRGAVAFYNDYTVTSSFLARVIDGAKAWDKIGTTLDYDYVTKANLSRNVCDPASFGKSLVYKAPIDGVGKTVGITETCFTGTKLLRFTMRFDSAESWYTSATLPIPSGKTDLLSVAAHEFGHATGWKSHLDGALHGEAWCANSQYQQTMCSKSYAGSPHQRTLGVHDVHTFDAVY
jgi:hypothetical protein